MIELESLIKEGWEHIDQYAGWLILKKEGQRLLYDPKKQDVYLRYDFNKPALTKLEAGYAWD